MASGKSLELAQIAPHPSPKCTCGAAYADHLRKDGKGVLKKFDTPDHRPLTITNGWNRKARRNYGR